MQTTTVKKPVITGSGLSQMMALDKIIPDPNQPRKTLDEIEDMAQSIKTDGQVLQPIMVRPIPDTDKFMIIFGERRYEGSKLLGLMEIPVMIREATDAEARVIQIIENLQRKDVHPMRQAIVFKEVLDSKESTIEDIGLRVGKSPKFVRQQIKLNSLNEKWQALFLKNGITLENALLICTLSENAQKEIYNSEVNKDEAKKDHPRVNLDSITISRYKGDLTTVAFDIANPDLDKAAGPCTTCRFNSSTFSLFPEDVTKPKCSNISCFKNKTSIHFNLELQVAKKDPAIALVYDGYYKPDLVEKLEKEKFVVLKMGYGDDCRTVKKPEKPEWEKFIKQSGKEKLAEKTLKVQFQKEQEQYTFENEVFEKHLATGKYSKAFVVGSNNRLTGLNLYVEITPKEKKSGSVKKGPNEKYTPAEIDQQIVDVNNREKRAKELDQEKIQMKIVEAVKADKSTLTIPTKATSVDNAILNFLLLDMLSIHAKPDLQKQLKCSALWEPKDGKQLLQSLQSISKNQLCYLIRRIVIDKFGTRLPNNPDGMIYRIMAESLGTIPIADFEKEQSEIAEKRQLRNKKGIAILKEMKKEAVELEKKKATGKPLTKIMGKSPTNSGNKPMKKKDAKTSLKPVQELLQKAVKNPANKKKVKQPA